MMSTRKYSKFLFILITMLCILSSCAVEDGMKKRSHETVAGKDAKQEYYELRKYVIESKEKQQVVSTYLEKAFLPGLKRMSIDRVGVFTSMDDSEDFSIFVLIPYKTLGVFEKLNDQLTGDKDYQIAAADFFALPKKTPAYKRIESRLMKAFAGMPVIEMPAQTKSKSPRIFELRIYESHNEQKANLKVEMFNSGEIQVMRDTKLAPVFYGQTLISNDVPNLVYMTSAANTDEHKKHWKAFKIHPEWQRLKKLLKYKDTVSKATKIFLVPTPYSQI